LEISFLLFGLERLRLLAGALLARINTILTFVNLHAVCVCVLCWTGAAVQPAFQQPGRGKNYVLRRFSAEFPTGRVKEPQWDSWGEST